MKLQIHHNTVNRGDFGPQFSRKGGSFRQEINRDTTEWSGTVEQMNLSPPHKHSTQALLKYTFFLEVPKTYSKTGPISQAYGSGF